VYSPFTAAVSGFRGLGPLSRPTTCRCHQQVIDVSEHTPSSTRHIARSSTDQPRAGLALTVQAIVDASVPDRERSLPAALCTVAGEVGRDASDHESPLEVDQFEQVLEPAVTATTLLEGYVRLRLALVSARLTPAADDTAHRTDWIDSLLEDGKLVIDRDAAILASDHLHASSYAMVAETPLPDRRRLELYRCLTEGSTTLAQQFLAQTRSEGGGKNRFGVEATLAETASALAATAVGLPTEIRSTLRTYSHALMTALASQSSLTADDVDPRTSAVRVLSDASSQQVAEDSVRVASAVESDLERARRALETLAESVGNARVAPGRKVEDASSPLARLERATRWPFRSLTDE